jgi:[ribosomal protein S5]-alanine N-acetyltransferase
LKKSIPTSFGMIRRWEEPDLDALVRYANNERVAINLTDGFPHPYLREHGEFFLNMVARQSPTRYFAIATREEAIGGIGITINEDVYRLTAELGYWLAEPFWGQGIMTEAVTKFSDYCFAQFELVRIFAQPYASNPKSARVLEKAGYALEGIMRCNVIKAGKILDQYLYAKVKQ